MNIFLDITNAGSFESKAKWVLTTLLVGMGHSVVENEAESEIVFQYLSDQSNLKKKKLSFQYVPSSLLINAPIDSIHSQILYFSDLLKKVESNKVDLVNNDLVKFEQEQILLKFDFISIVFKLLSQEEYLTNSNRDEYDRLPFSLSIIPKELIEHPIIDKVGSWLNKLLEHGCNEIGIIFFRKKIWPGFHPAAASFSHDVDIVDFSYFRYWKAFVGSISRRETSIANFLRCFLYDFFLRLTFQKSPYCNFQLDTIVEHHKRNNLKATFNIISSKAGRKDNPDYLKIAKKSLQEILSYGHEIGLHGGFESKSFQFFESMKAEKERIEALINQKVYSTRQHYLGFDRKKTFEIQDQVGLKIDSSVGYPDHPGFRASYTLPFKNWSFSKQQPTQVFEIPLILMDGTLMSKRYGGMNLEKAKLTFDHYLQETVKSGGILTINWHQRVFSEGPFESWMKLYRYIVKKVQSTALYIATKRKLIERYVGIANLSLRVADGFFHMQSNSKLTDVFVELNSSSEIQISGLENQGISQLSLEGKRYLRIKVLQPNQELKLPINYLKL